VVAVIKPNLGPAFGMGYTALMMDQVLTLFDDQIANWFHQTYGAPTDIQRQTWPQIADQKNLLISAPTGSGKTPTAFLWAINEFIAGNFESGTTRVLYISPLKALNNDIQLRRFDRLFGLTQRTQFRFVAWRLETQKILNLAYHDGYRAIIWSTPATDSFL